MARIIFISGPCGTGKTTFTNAYAGHLIDNSNIPVDRMVREIRLEDFRV